MSKMTTKQVEQINVCARVYAECNAAQWLFIAKPMRKQWYGYKVPMSADNVAAIISDVETSDEGLKFRFRPSNSVFYRVAARNGVTPQFMASDDYVTNLMTAIAAETGSRVNRGIAIESIAAEIFGAQWAYNPTQAGFWMVPDVISNKGETIQVKAYGGSVTEKDLHAAVKAMRK